MKKIYFIIIISIVTFLLQGCEESLLHEEYQNTPLDNYEAFWSEFDQFYGAFEAKNINWDSLKVVYGKNLYDNPDNTQLYFALKGLLNELNDGHADLSGSNINHFRSWNRRSKPFFGDIKTFESASIVELQDLIRTKYMNNNFKSGKYSGWNFFWGTIPYKNSKIGYICIPTFNNSDYPNGFIQQAVDSFNHLDAVVIDLRYNGGGRTDAFVTSLNSFASEKKCYMKSKFRNGPDHSDFTDIADHTTFPHSNCLKNKPVAVLMNSYSASSSDHFILGMKSQSYVISVGDTTCGAFSSVIERSLPNGWKFRLGAEVVYSPDGNLLSDSKGKYLEGIGIAPDYYCRDMLKEVRKGNDLPLNVALSELYGRIGK
jgi:carboxyl-terminal processing protease